MPVDPRFLPKLTSEQKEQIFQRARKGESSTVLAKEYGVTTRTISKIKYNKKRLQKELDTLDAHQMFAKLRIHDGAIKGVEKEHEILDREVPEGEKGTSLLYLQHQVASSLMDRDGLKAVDKSESKAVIVFGEDDIPMGMPENTDDAEDAEDAEEEEDA